MERKKKIEKKKKREEEKNVKFDVSTMYVDRAVRFTGSRNKCRRWEKKRKDRRLFETISFKFLRW